MVEKVYDLFREKLEEDWFGLYVGELSLHYLINEPDGPTKATICGQVPLETCWMKQFPKIEMYLSIPLLPKEIVEDLISSMPTNCSSNKIWTSVLVTGSLGDWSYKLQPLVNNSSALLQDLDFQKRIERKSTEEFEINY